MLADIFIQSDLESCVHSFYVWVVPAGIKRMTLWSCKRHALQPELQFMQNKNDLICYEDLH